MDDIKKIASQLGRDEIGTRLGVKAGAVSAAVVAGRFPASWYQVVSDLGREKGVWISPKLFGWKKAEGVEQ